MKPSMLISVLSAVFCAAALDYPVITVETDGGTLASPLRLDEMDVSVISEENAEPATVSFASLGKPTTGTFRKRGSGFVMSSFNMTNFTGTVLIEEGAMCCEGPGSFGPPNNTAGPLVISNGASLVLAGHKETMEAYHMELWNPITLEGTGVGGIGAIYDKTKEVTSRNAIKSGPVTLSGDAYIVGNGHGELGTDSSNTPGFDLKGHTLTIGGSNGMLWNNAVVQPGNIVLASNALLRVQTALTLKGGATNEFKVSKGATFATYNGGSFKAPWTLVFDGGVKLSASGSKNSNQVSTLGRHQWQGPITVNGNVTVSSGDTLYNEGWSLLGPVTGAGGFSIDRGYLNLTNDLNDFRGPVLVTRPSSGPGGKTTLGLWNRNAWPQANEHPLISTNSALYFGKNTDYNLPKIFWHNEPAFTNSYMYGTATHLVTPGIVKTGGGALEIPGQLTATNRTELRAGVLRLAPPGQTPHSSEPGVWECLTRFGSAPDNDTFAAYYTNGTQADTNGVTTALRYMQKSGTAKTEPSWGDYQVSRYVGYVWNRSSETQRWSLAMASIKGRLLLDDTLVLKQENTWYWLATNTISVSPGPHKFDIRFYNTTYAEGGAKDAYRIENGLTGAKMKIDDGNGGKTDEPLPERWPKNFGFGIDVQGRSSLYSADYVKPANGTGALEGGDGLWFTRTTNTVESAIADGSFAAAHLRSSFATLAATHGTTLDLGGGDVYVRDLEGFTRATNGTLRVSGTWTLDAAAAMNGTTLAADDNAKVVFGADACVAVDDISQWKRRGEVVTILEADEIEGMPAPAPALKAEGARLVKNAGTLGLFLAPRGTLVMFR